MKISDELLESLAEKYIIFSRYIRYTKNLMPFVDYLEWCLLHDTTGEILEEFAERYTEFSEFTRNRIPFVEYVEWCLLQD